MIPDYYLLESRISLMEKHIEELIQWFNKIAPEINELVQQQEDRCPKVCI